MIRPVSAELFHGDGRTGMMKLVVAFLNIANAPQNGLPVIIKHLVRGQFTSCCGVPSLDHEIYLQFIASDINSKPQWCHIT